MTIVDEERWCELVSRRERGFIVLWYRFWRLPKNHHSKFHLQTDLHRNWLFLMSTDDLRTKNCAEFIPGAIYPADLPALNSN